jgi:RsmE family RNA methyltransferase
MNLVLLSTEEVASGRIAGADARAVHIREVLRARAGDVVFVGSPNGKRGRAVLSEVSGLGVRWSDVEWEREAPVALPLGLVVGLSRPQTMRRVLHEGAALGFARMDVFCAAKGDPAYARSSLWRDGEAAGLLHRGAEQAFTTLVPELAVHESLESALEAALALPAPGRNARVFLDVYEAESPLDTLVRGNASATLAVGPERGWSGGEREVLRARGFVGAHMGERVLRVESACVAAGGVALAALGVWRRHQIA